MWHFIENGDAFDPLAALQQQCAEQEPGMGRADAKMRARSKSDMRIGFAVETHFVGGREHRLVPIGRRPA